MKTDFFNEKSDFLLKNQKQTHPKTIPMLIFFIHEIQTQNFT